MINKSSYKRRGQACKRCASRDSCKSIHRYLKAAEKKQDLGKLNPENIKLLGRVKERLLRHGYSYPKSDEQCWMAGKSNLCFFYEQRIKEAMGK